MTTPYVHGMCDKTKELKHLPMAGFAKQMPVTLGDPLLIKWAAPFNTAAVCVLHSLFLACPGYRRAMGRSEGA